MERHDRSHEPWLLSCGAEPVMSDHPHLFNVRSADSPASVCLCGAPPVCAATFIRSHNPRSILLFIKPNELEPWIDGRSTARGPGPRFGLHELTRLLWPLLVFQLLSKKNTILTNQPCCRLVCARLLLDWSALLSSQFIGLPSGADLTSKQTFFIKHHLGFLQVS